VNFLTSQCEWITSPLIEVATLKRGYDLPVQDRSDGPHPIFAANGTVGFHVSAKCRGPGVVTGRSGTIGKVHFVEHDYWPLNTSLYVTDFHGNDPKWVYYMLQSFGLERFSQGAGVPTLNRNLIHGEPIRVPTVPEQRRIAAILDQADTLRAKRREALAQLDSLTQSIFIEMFGDAQVDPNRWRKVVFDEIVKESRIGLVRGSQELDSGHPFPYLRMNAITREGGLKIEGALFAKATAEELNIYKLRRDDFLFNTRNSRELVGKTALFRSDDLYLFNNNLLRVRFTESAHPEYVIAAFKTQFIQNELEIRKSGTTNVFAVYYKDLRTLPVPLPPLALQQTFASRVRVIESLKGVHQVALAELNTLFASLQHRAFRGEL
jgi:type I restriction enzyme S subunit